MRIERGVASWTRIVLEKKLGGRRKVEGTRAETVLRRTAAHDDIHQIKRIIRRPLRGNLKRLKSAVEALQSHVDIKFPANEAIDKNKNRKQKRVSQA